MFASLQEKGSRPALMTPARLNAPAGAKVIVDLLAPHDFADVAFIVIDWDGDINWDPDNGPMPAELRKPTLAIFASKWYPPINRRAKLEVFLDMDDAFGKDTFDHNVAEELVQYMREEFTAKREEFEAGVVK